MYIQEEPKRLFSRFVANCMMIASICWGFVIIKTLLETPPEQHPFAPTPTPTLTAQFYRQTGDTHFTEGKLREAITAYEKAISLEPEHDWSYRQQASALIFIRDTGKSLYRAEQAVLLNPNTPENLASYCWALDWEGHYADAVAACQCAIELDPTYAPAYAFLSEVYSDQSLWRLAREQAEQALTVDANSPEAHHNLAYALQGQGRRIEAIEYYENAIQLKPTQPFYYGSAGENYFWLEQYSNSADRLRQAIKLDPLNPRYYDQLGWTYFYDGEYVRAVDALEQAIQIDSTYARAWGRLGTLYYFRQNYEKAVQILPKAIKLSNAEFLKQARWLEILTEINGISGPEIVPILQGRFTWHEQDGLIAEIEFIDHNLPDSFSGDLPTCGNLIAKNIENRATQIGLAQNIAWTHIFSQTYGRAVLNISTGELTLNLNRMPTIAEKTYEVQIRYRPNTPETLGYFPSTQAEHIEAQFTISDKARAPAEYYYQLGLSYAYMRPAQCDQAIPWLLAAVEKLPAYYNPAWEGLKICPTDVMPATPVPPVVPNP